MSKDFFFRMESPNDQVADQLCPCLQVLLTVQEKHINSVFFDTCTLSVSSVIGWLPYIPWAIISVAKSYEPVSNSRQNIVLMAHLPHTQFLNVELGVKESLGVGGGGKVGTKTIHVIHHYFSSPRDHFAIMYLHILHLSALNPAQFL